MTVTTTTTTLAIVTVIAAIVINVKEITAKEILPSRRSLLIKKKTDKSQPTTDRNELSNKKISDGIAKC